jgi:hypothetical protein
MNRPLRWVLAAAALACVTAAPLEPALARSKTKIEWSAVRVPEGKGSERTAKMLRGFLTQAAKKADFGSAKSVKLTARVVEFTAVKKGDILQVSCSIVGRLVGGPSARSRISFGGNPAEREQLEKQVLSMVANGLVTRLAEIAKTRAAREQAEKEAEKEAADE